MPAGTFPASSFIYSHNSILLACRLRFGNASIFRMAIGAAFTGQKTGHYVPCDGDYARPAAMTQCENNGIDRRFGRSNAERRHIHS